MNNNSAIKVGAVISYIGIFLNIAISFFYTPWMIRQIGVSDYGLYSLIISFISYFIMDFGLAQAIQRFIAKYRAANDEDRVAKMVGITTKVYLLIDAVIFAVLFVLYFFIKDIFTGLTPDEIERLKVLYVIAGTFSVLTFMFKPVQGAMMAYEYFVEDKLLDMIQKVGTVAVVCIALLCGADVFALVLINGAFSLLTSVSKFVIFKRKSRLKIQWGYFNRQELKDIFSFSMWTFGISLAQRMRISIVPSVLGILSNSVEISIFALGITIEGMLFSFAHAINGLFLPKVSRIIHDNDKTAVNRLFVRVGRIQLFVVMLVFSGFIVYGKSFLHLWVGDDFANAYWIIVCFIVPNIILYTQHIADDVVYVENKIRYTATMTFVTSAIGLLAACLLIPVLGAIGGALGTGIGLLVNMFWLNIFYKKNLGLNIVEFICNCHFRILPILVVLAFAFIVAQQYCIIDSWPKLIVGVLIYGLCYLFISYFCLFNDEEKQMVNSMIKKV